MLERKVLKTQPHLTETLPWAHSKQSSTAKKKKMAPVTCNVLLSGPQKIASAMGDAQPLCKAAVPRERKKVEAMTGDSVAAVLCPLCLHVFVPAVPLARSSLSNLLSSLLARHYLLIKITLGPPPPKGPP